MAETAALADRLQGLLAQSEELIAAGRREEALARMKDPVVQDLLDSVRHRLDDFLAEEGRLDELRMEALHASGQRQTWVIGGGRGGVRGDRPGRRPCLFGRSVAGRLAQADRERPPPGGQSRN